MEIGGPNRRALGFGVTLAVVLYVSALLVALDHRLELGQRSGFAAVLFGCALLVALAVLAAAAVRHRFSSARGIFLLSLAASLALVAVLFLALHLAEPFFGEASLFSAQSVLIEAIAGYWRTLALLFGAVLFTWLYRDARGLVDSLVAMPVFMWGFDATRSHWVALSAHSHSPAFHLQMLWFGALVSSLTLLGVLAAAFAWRRLCGPGSLRSSVLTPFALTVPVVYADWAFSLLVISMTRNGAWPAT